MTTKSRSRGERPVVLGAGFTGLAIGHASRSTIFEAADSPGGICCSYYMAPGGTQRAAGAATAAMYRFEIGGGHWIFGGDPEIMSFLQRFATLRSYTRRSAVYFSESKRYVDYPLQDHLDQLEPERARAAAAEMAASQGLVSVEPGITQAQWNAERFGPTLCELFFDPFNERYTAGLYRSIAAQDAYKSPLRNPRGYNATFVYPIGGLDALARGIAKTCRVEYQRRAVSIDASARLVTFADGTSERYEALISTLPLNRTLQLANVSLDARSDPYTAALILNVGATRGPQLPSYHWIYVPDSNSGFHRVGIYSNVDRDFLPRDTNGDDRRVSLYVERAYPGGTSIAASDLANYANAAIEELQRWGFIESLEVLDPSWVEVAYTWSWPASTWRSSATRTLAGLGIIPAGRFGRWIYQGIADSIREGLSFGSPRGDR